MLDKASGTGPPERADRTPDWLTRNPPELGGIGGMRVGIVGLGGLGSNIAMMLARAGVTSLRLADFDSVASENLNRQHYFPEHVGLPKTEALAAQLRALNPRIELDLWACKVKGSCLEAFCEGCVVVTEAVDDAATKAMLFSWFMRHSSSPWFVTASGLGGIMPANDVRTVKLADRIVACGDFSTPSENKFGVCAPRVMLAASHQALAILRILTGVDPT